jgi:outer membrane protein W
MRRTIFSLALLTALPLAAQTEVGIIVGHVDSNVTDIDGTSLDFHHGRAFGAAIERRAENASIELAAMALRADGTLRTEGASADAGTLKLFPISVTARWHFAPRGERLDPYVGAGAAYVKASALTSSDLDALGIGGVDVQSKACWLANAGVALGWFFLDGKYLSYRPNGGPPDGRVRLNLKPVVISAGFRWRL